MRAAVLREGKIISAEVPTPEPAPGEVLVRTVACGICGSDLHALHRAEHPEPADGGDDSPGMVLTDDIVMGHEFSAEIADFGKDTPRRFKPGDKVCSIPILVRGGKAGFIGYTPEFPGGYGEFMRLNEEHLIAIPNGLPADRAALTEPMAVGYRAVLRAQLGPDDVPLVIGCGPVGLAVIAALKLRKAHPIVAADFSPERRRLALAMGADVVVDPAEQSPYDSWRAMAQTGLPDPGPTLPGWLVGSGLKPAVIFECVGARGLIDQIVRGVPQDARIVLVGLCQHQDHFHPMTAITKELTLIFSNSYNGAQFAQTLRHIAEGEIDVEPLITGRTGTEGVMQAFRTLQKPEGHAKILVEPWRA